MLASLEGVSTAPTYSTGCVNQLLFDVCASPVCLRVAVQQLQDREDEPVNVWQALDASCSDHSEYRDLRRYSPL